MPGGFFSTSNSPSYYRAGRGADSLFRAMAGLIYDYVCQGKEVPPSVNEEVMAGFTKYFPEKYPVEVQAGSNSLKGFFLSHRDKTELIGHLGFILRQMTVDELHKNLLGYFKALVVDHSLVSPETMRLDSTPVNFWILAALANKLGISIKLAITEGDKSIPLTVSFNRGQKPCFKLECHDGEYQFKVPHGMPIARDSRRIPYPDVAQNEKGTLEFLRLVTEINTKAAKMARFLSLALETGELSQEAFDGLYIASLPVHGRGISIPYGMEYGSEGVILVLVGETNGSYPKTNVLFGTELGDKIDVLAFYSAFSESAKALIFNVIDSHLQRPTLSRP